MTNQEKYDNITLLSDNSVILSKNRGEKMRPLNDELAAKILEAGKNEFLIETAREHIHIIKEFYTAGWYKILGI